MEQNTAKQIISEALNIAVARGCFNLVEVTNLVKALDVLNEELARANVVPNVELGEVTED